MYCFHKLNKAQKDQKIDFLSRVEGKGKIDNLPFTSESYLSAFSREYFLILSSLQSFILAFLSYMLFIH